MTGPETRSAPTPTPTPTPAQLQALVQAARAVRSQAYAPYSGFAVGAAVLDMQGRIHAGANVENAAYPQGLCAEASAIAHMTALGGRGILAVAVVGDAGPNADPVTPCGGCRQKLREFAGPEVPVLVDDTRTLRAQYTLGALLPASFGPNHLVAQPQLLSQSQSHSQSQPST